MRPLGQVWAKSRAHPGEPRGELLTEHLGAVADAARVLERRVGRIPRVPPYFWSCVVLACLFHDAGKIPEGFQRMVGNPGPAVRWGHRHEIYSLGFVWHVLSGLPADQLDLVALGVATHHRPLSGGPGSLKALRSSFYRSAEDLAEAIGPVDPDAAAELHAWLGGQAGAGTVPAPAVEKLAAAAHQLLGSVISSWNGQAMLDADHDLAGILLQGAVTLADHAGSAHTALLTCQPAGPGYVKELTGRLQGGGKTLFPHQAQALAVTGHMLLRAPTGYGKTEGALLWACTQVADLSRRCGGIPRLFYTLPYLASINAMTGRLREELDPDGEDLIGVAHSRAASYYLRLAADDCASSHEDPDDLAAAAADRALARTRATRLFREPVRVGTPYQLVRGALAGPAHSAIVVDAANSVFILDELHAYEPRKLGIVLAMMRLWVRLGSRVAVVSATLPAALADLITAALGEQPALAGPPDSWKWPVRHQLALRPEHLTALRSVSEIAGRLRDGRSVLVIANSVADAINLYQQLAPEVVSTHGQDAALLLHSRFRGMDRDAIEQKILARFQAGQPRQPGLLVATQTVEVSLNVDFDVTHTSGAPLESLIQRFGRVNRLGTLPAPAPVVVHQPSYGPRRNGGAEEYADGVYAAEPVRLAWQILDRHDGDQLDEKLFGQWLDGIYASDWGENWKAEVTRTRRHWDTWLRFADPFHDRSQLAEEFDQLFEGSEAVLEQDAGKYRRLLTDNTPAAGRLLAAGLLLPIPRYGTSLGRWDKSIGATVITADYDSHLGLRKIHGPAGNQYVPGEVL